MAWPAVAATWDPVFDLLARDHTVIAPDLPGHGESDKPVGSDYSLGALASSLRDLLLSTGHLGATVVGHSLGGGIAMQFAYQFPSRCERLVLVGAGGLGPDVSPMLRVLTFPGMEYLFPVLFASQLRDAGKFTFSLLKKAGLRRSANVEEVWRSYVSLTDPPTRAAFVRTLRSVVDLGGQHVSAHDRLPLAADIPTLIVWGDSDAIIPVHHADAARETLPHEPGRDLRGIRPLPALRGSRTVRRGARRLHRDDRAGPGLRGADHRGARQPLTRSPLDGRALRVAHGAGWRPHGHHPDRRRRRTQAHGRCHRRPRESARGPVPRRRPDPTRVGHHAAGPRASAGTPYSVDLRGHGDSGWAPDGDYTLEAFARDALVIARSFDTKPAMVGASLGGISSLAAIGDSTRAGDACARALVLVDVAPKIEQSGVSRIGDFMTANLDGFESLDEVADVIAAYNPHRPRPKNLDGLKKNLRQRADGRWVWHWDPRFVSGKFGSPDETRSSFVEAGRLDNDARSLDIPTLLVRGRMSDLLSEEGAQDLLRLVPHAELVDVAGAGHMVAGDRNDAFNGAVVEFLESVRSAAA